MIPLPVIESCEGCGACCMEQGSPPGYLWLRQLDPDARSAWPDEDDVKRVATLPAEAMAAVEEYAIKLMAGEVSGEGPCCWLDRQTMRCRWHEQRPQICRDFEVGSMPCQAYRHAYGVRAIA